jgi:hypothetical protein
MNDLPDLPRTVVTDATGERHRVTAWHRTDDMYDGWMVDTECGQIVLLSGNGHPDPKPCPREKT